MENFCILAASRPWYADSAERLTRETGMPFRLAENPPALKAALAETGPPLYIFFPHWSWIVPENIWSRHECVMFHMTALPFGRGGSPLQNLIVRGFTETKISAFRGQAGVDTGPIYCQEDLQLYGSAEEIFLRAAVVVRGMIARIIREQPVPQPQQGEATVFRRRTEEEGDIGRLATLRQIYDHIRMLDAEGYPPAFLRFGPLRLEFTRAALRRGKIEADVTIRLPGNAHEK
jgi:methionyl-tRNA formyltransferase